MSPNDADGMTNSVDPDQTAPLEQSDLGLHCLSRHICPKTDHYGKSVIFTLRSCTEAGMALCKILEQYHNTKHEPSQGLEIMRS